MRISKERVLEAVRRSGGRGLSDKDLLRALGAPRGEIRALRGLLRGMVRGEQLERVDGRFRVPLVRGGGSRRPSPGPEPPIPRRLIGLLRRGRRGIEARPYPDDRSWEICLEPRQRHGAGIGDVVAMTPEGRVIEVLGRPGEPRPDFEAVVAAHQIPTEFPQRALAEAGGLEERLEAAEVRRRVDLRDRSFVTIDPETARDHDDAICIERLPSSSSRLWVAIADVAHYVRPGSAIDAEALRRGNSVYFPDRAIPMLPERLSSELCSLRPERDRLAMVVELVFDGSAHPLRRSFYPAVIRSRARLTYAVAAEVMDGGSGGVSRSLRAGLHDLATLAEKLMRRRFEAGSIDFDLPSAEIVLGDEGHPVDIVETPRSIAHRAVEEAMLAANRAVAETLGRARAPALFRVHEPPDEAELRAFHEALRALGWVDGGTPHPLPSVNLAQALARPMESARARVVHMLVLRTMRQAGYEARDRGHFALAFRSYTHFTSPIRRYADLVVHRALKGLLEADAGFSRGRKHGGLEAIAAHLSRCERRAMAAEREIVALKKCAFMARKLGEEFDATVTGVARHGLFVTLDGLQVDGLVHASTLGRAATLDATGFTLVVRSGGGKSRRRYRLGDRLRVRVDGVELGRAWIRLAVTARLGSPGERGPR